MSKDPPKPSKFLPKGGFSNYVAFYLPSKLKSGAFITGIDRENLIATTMTFLLNTFRGSTQSEGIGYFKGGVKIHAERVTICKSFSMDPFTPNQLKKINRFANSLAVVFNQESISVEIDGTMYFFEPKWAYKKRGHVIKTTTGRVYGYEAELAKKLSIPSPDKEA
jgi:hypothetical protein